MSGAFEAGRNIALKVPPHQYEATVAFYRDVLGFRAIGRGESGGSSSGRCSFGSTGCPA